MAGGSKPRHGSLQFWPRKRAEKQIPSVNWKVVKGDGKTDSLLGFIAYKAGMGTALVKDSTDKSMTIGKKIYIPITVLEVPNMKIYSVRFYKHGKVLKDVVVSADKELKRVILAPKQPKNLDQETPKEFEDIRVIAYSMPSQTSIKKTPDLIELGIEAKDKLAFVKSIVGKEISLKDFLKYQLLDLRGLTKGKGLVGPVKRMGIGLKAHKSEKGVRRPGTLGPWHPAHTSFRVAQAGQLGMFSRVIYNSKVVGSGTIAEKNINPVEGFNHYGNIKSSYILLKGSVQGPQKRQILLTPSFRPTKSMMKKKYELMEFQS
ncbi:MAG TPA: 50S ribosomal protein L3 [Candidatus Nanoarchaeia archaeon]|nr:50S ribosomal protein L3 [Candidatus Nanoarchaeia archaeon]